MAMRFNCYSLDLNFELRNHIHIKKPPNLSRCSMSPEQMDIVDRLALISHLPRLISSLDKFDSRQEWVET